MGLIEIHQLLGRITIGVVLGDEGHKTLLWQTVRIFLESRTDGTHLTPRIFHKNFD